MKPLIKLINFYSDPSNWAWAISLWMSAKMLMEKYVYKDWQFVMFLAIIVSLDTCLGIWKSIKNKTFTSRAYGQVLEKILIYSSLLVLTHVLSNYTVDGERSSFFTWLDTVLYGLIMVRESASVFENIEEIRPGMVPKFIMERFKKANESGKLEDIAK